MLNTTASDISFDNDQFSVKLMNGETLKSAIVIGAFGKRSVLDKKLDRGFFNQKTDYVGVKHHFKADFPNDVVALHNFEGGYCGLSRVENDHVNLCYLTTTKVFKKYSSIEEIEENHLSQNPHLKKFLHNSESIFDPIVISQVNFSMKKSVENHVLMSGDTAGLIHPLCGNGMAMAIHSAKICSGVVDAFLHKRISRKEMERKYEQEWNRAFNVRLKFAQAIQGMFGKPILSNLGLSTLGRFPYILNKLVQLSHGKEVY